METIEQEMQRSNFRERHLRIFLLNEKIKIYACINRNGDDEDEVRYACSI